MGRTPMTDRERPVGKGTRHITYKRRRKDTQPPDPKERPCLKCGGTGVMTPAPGRGVEIACGYCDGHGTSNPTERPESVEPTAMDLLGELASKPTPPVSGACRCRWFNSHQIEECEYHARLLAEAEAKGRLAKSQEIEKALGLPGCVCGQCELDTEVLKATIESLREAAHRKGRREQLEEDRAAVCFHCKRGTPHEDGYHIQLLRRWRCTATALREGDSEDKG